MIADSSFDSNVNGRWWTSGGTPPAGRLLRRCLDAIGRLQYGRWPYRDIPAEVVLAMPPQVANVYLAEDALPLHEYEHCGFGVPVTPGEHKGRPAWRHFDACPLCGGRVGWYAYFNRRKAETDAGSFSPAVSTA